MGLPTPSLEGLYDVQPRPSLMMVARMQELKLRQHDATKGGQDNWRKDSVVSLMKRLHEELREADEAWQRNEYSSLDTAWELADVANFAMMAIDRMLQWPMADDPQPEGVKP